MNLFQCTVLNCKLTDKACGKRYSKAMSAGTWKTETQIYRMCESCPTGEKNLHLVPEEERGLTYKKNAPGAPALWGRLRRHKDESIG